MTEDQSRAAIKDFYHELISSSSLSENSQKIQMSMKKNIHIKITIIQEKLK